MKQSILILSTLALLSSSNLTAKDGKGKFSIVKEINHLPVIDQGSTGTCWSFATTSFLEAEIIRKGYPETDLSEMFFVYHGYENKAKNFMLFHGANNFGQGGLAHDVLNVLRENGAATFESFPGELVDGEYRHRELEAKLKKEVIDLNKKRGADFNVSDLSSIEPILKKGLGRLPRNIKTDEGKISTTELRDRFGLNSDDYVELTSYIHHPFYKAFSLEIPDNWAHSLYFNLPIDELMEVMYSAINKGYSIAWDGDMSEKTFRYKAGLADLPEDQLGKVDQTLRQKTFYDRSTTDDHLMHIVGLSKDESGRNCFYTKNSWGANSNEFGGYLNMTDDYVRLKTISIMVHKDAIPADIRSKLGI